jgi:hypothetical protein
MSGCAWPENYWASQETRTSQGFDALCLALEGPKKINNIKHVPDRLAAAGDVLAYLPTVTPHSHMA